MGKNLPIAWPAAVFAVIACVLAVTWWRFQVPFPFLGSDAGNIASFTAGWLSPDAWNGDEVLANPGNYRFYATVHIPLLAALSWLVGDLGTAFVLLLPVALWLNALSHWHLGRVLFGTAPGAWALGLMSFGMVSLGIDHYGTYPDVLPRFLFQIVLPLLLAGLLRRADTPGRWPGLFAGHGLAVYLHPVSAPSAALASWLTLALTRPRRWLALVGAGVAFVVPAVPFALNYLSGHAHGTPADYDAAAARHLALFGPAFGDGLVYARDVLGGWQIRWFVPAWGLAGAVAVWVLAPARRRHLVLLLAWAAMMVVSSLGVTLAEQALCRSLRVLPVEIDTIRNLRYVVPVLMVVGLWGVVEAAGSASRRAMVLPLAAAAIWLLANKPGVTPVRDTVACLARGHMVCVPEEWTERRAMLVAVVAGVPAGTGVLPAVDRYEGTDVSLALRYYARRPVVFSFKDGSTALGYANHAALDRWTDVAARLERAHHDGDWRTISDLADALDAGAIVADIPVVELSGWLLLHRAGRYSVLVRSPT